MKGPYDKSVLDKQLVLVRSRLFRKHAVDLLSKKAGSQTPGIDNEIYDKKDEMYFDNLVEDLRKIVYHPKRYKANPIKRVWIPKPGKNEKRPLGIPTIKDRALQCLVNLALLPLVEMNSDPNSYGFRPHRDCKMAIAAVRIQLKNSDIENMKKSIHFSPSGRPRIGGNIDERSERRNKTAHLLKCNQDR